MKPYTPQKILFKLNSDDRHAMLDKILGMIQKRLFTHKAVGIKFKDIANTTGLPKQRISEVYHGRYISEETILLLVNHGYIRELDLFALDLTAEQGDVLIELLDSPSPTPQSSSKAS